MTWEPLFDALTDRFPRAEIEHLPNQPSTVHLLAESAAEYRALTEACAVVVTPLLLPIVIEGRDAIDYLHRRLSQDVKAIADNAGAWALQLDGTGHIEMECLLYRGGGSLWALVERHQAEAAVAMIEKYVFHENVVLHKQWHAEGIVAFAGPKATEALATALSPDADWLNASWGACVAAELKTDAQPIACRIFRDGRWASPYYQIMAPLPALPELVMALEALAERFGGGMAGARAHDFFRIELGMPFFGRETGESVNPLEAGMTAALSFDKGCYPGQEVIARTTNLGHPARLLAALQWPAGTAGLKPGAELVYAQSGGESAGFVTSVAELPGVDRIVGLGFVRWARRHAEQLGVVLADGDGGHFAPTAVRVLHCPDSGANPCVPDADDGDGKA